MINPRLILSRATRSLDFSVSNKDTLLQMEFANLLESVANHYRLCPSTPLPKTIEIMIRQERWDVQMWIACLAEDKQDESKQAPS